MQWQLFILCPALAELVTLPSPSHRCVPRGAIVRLGPVALQSHDFVHVSKIVQANLLALDKPEANGQVINVGTGRRLDLLDMITALRDQLGAPEPAGPKR